MATLSSPSEIWNHIDRMSRVECCHAASGETCKGFHPQGTRIVYGYEALSDAVRTAVFKSRNTAIDAAIDQISGLATKDGHVSKAEVLEILVGLKWREV